MELKIVSNYCKSEIRRCKDLSNSAKYHGIPEEEVAWNHSMLAYMDILKIVEELANEPTEAKGNQILQT